MKKLLLLLTAATVLAGCAKEDSVQPKTVQAAKQQQNMLADDDAGNRAAGRAVGAADANYLAASYSTGGDTGGWSGSASGDGIGLPGEPNYGNSGGTLAPRDGGPDFYGIGGGVSYDPGHTAHSYSIPGDQEANFERDLAGIRASGEQHLQGATTPEEALYYQGYLEGIDNYLMI